MPTEPDAGSLEPPVVVARPTLPEDISALSRLFAERFGHPLTREEWEWKYSRLPGAGRSIVACDGQGALLAHAGAIGLPARWQGGEGLLWQLVDFVGVPGSLRPPVLVAARRLLADLPAPGEVPWNYGFPSRRHLELGSRVLGYRWIADVQPWEGALPEGGSADSYGVESLEVCGPWAREVWEACSVLGIVRSTELLNWRYYGRPDRYYRCYRLRQEQSEGLVVAAFVGTEAWLAELWLPPGADWLAPLLDVASDLRQAGLERWRAWPLPEADRTETLYPALGLAPAREPFLLTARPGDEVVVPARGLHYAMGDYDTT